VICEEWQRLRERRNVAQKAPTPLATTASCRCQNASRLARPAWRRTRQPIRSASGSGRVASSASPCGRSWLAGTPA
jgi:hypothetical protein